MKGIRMELRADLLLVLYALIMGVTSVTLKLATKDMGIPSFIALRFCIAFVLCLVLFFNRCRSQVTRPALFHSLLIGVVTYGAHVCCTTGISMTPVSVAGFLTNLQTVVIPLIAFLFLRQRFDRRTLLCILGAFVSIALITLGNSIEYGTGVGLCIGSSVLASVQILLIEKYVQKGDDPVVLTIGQLAVMAVCAVAAGFSSGGIQLPQSSTGWLCVAYTGVISTALATYIQTYAQRYTTSVHTGIIFSSIPVFTLIGGRLAFQESFTPRAAFGAALMVICVVATELRPDSKRECPKANISE